MLLLNTVKQIISKAKKTFTGEIKIPGDKSISHRSVIFGSIAHGITEVDNFLEGEDCLCTKEAFEALGVDIKFEGEANNKKLIINGKGFEALKKPSKEIYLGNSGTGMRLLAGLFSGLPFQTVLTGDESLSKRPMARVINPLSSMGAEIESQDGKAPLVINKNNSTEKLKPISYKSPIASAQVKSSILLAGLNAKGTTKVSEDHRSRNHTELMMQSFGAELQVNGLEVALSSPDFESGDKLIGQKFTVPSDISSAAFFMVAAAILPGAELRFKNINTNQTRSGIIDLMKAMNVDITVENERLGGKEPVADITVKHSKIQGITFGSVVFGDSVHTTTVSLSQNRKRQGLRNDENLSLLKVNDDLKNEHNAVFCDSETGSLGEEIIPRLIDEIPIISILAAQASGTTTIKGAEELKVKESNRIRTTVNLLKALGVNVEETDDGMIIEGRAGKEFEPKAENIDNGKITIDSHGDHRIAMSAAIAALHSQTPIEILQTEFVNTSFPNFFDLLPN